MLLISRISCSVSYFLTRHPPSALHLRPTYRRLLIHLSVNRSNAHFWACGQYSVPRCLFCLSLSRTMYLFVFPGCNMQMRKMREMNISAAYWPDRCCCARARCCRKSCHLRTSLCRHTNVTNVRPTATTLIKLKHALSIRRIYWVTLYKVPFAKIRWWTNNEKYF